MIPSRLLIATDFSESSRTALDFAARLGRQSRAELHVMHAQDPLLAAAAKERGYDLAAEAQEELQRFVAQTPAAAASINGRTPRYHVHVGSAVDAILTVARREQIDLIVVGSRGISGAERLIFGSTTEGLLRRSELSVFVIPDRWSPVHPAEKDLSGTGPVIVGVDMTEPSIVAAKEAAQIASLLDTELVLLHIVPELRVLDRWRAHATAALQANVTAATIELERMVQGLPSGIAVRVQVETGSVPESIAEGVDRVPKGLLVLGRANRADGNSPPGTVAYRVLTLARVPVLMHVMGD